MNLLALWVEEPQKGGGCLAANLYLFTALPEKRLGIGGWRISNL